MWELQMNQSPHPKDDMGESEELQPEIGDASPAIPDGGNPGTEPDQSQDKRKHVTSACSLCRQSKIRCDNQRPCGNCKKKGRETLCDPPANGDKRKVRSQKQAIQILCNRTEQLALLLKQHGLALPLMTGEDTKQLIDVCDPLAIEWSYANVLGIGSAQEAQGLRHFSEQNYAPIEHQSGYIGGLPQDGNALYSNSFISPPLPAHATHTEWPTYDVSTDPSNAVSDWSMFDYSNPALPGMVPGFHANSQHGITYASTPWTPPTQDAQLTTATTDDSNDDPGDFEPHFLERLSARFGTLKIAPDGKTKYIGPGSNAQFLDDDGHYRQIEEQEMQRIQAERDSVLKHSTVGQLISAELESRLVNLYFQYQESIFPIVDRKVYESAKQKARAGNMDRGFYSDGLTNAMCALGAAHDSLHDPAFEGLSKTPPLFFADRTKTLLQVDVEYPSVATVQSLVLLSAHELASNKDAGGWIYSGMAMRLCLDLGLERDCTSFVQEHLIEPEEAKARALAFWGCFVMNHLWSFCLGRPFRVEGDITVPHPEDLISSPAIAVEPGFGHPVNSASRWSFDPFNKIIELCEKAGPIMHELFGTSAIVVEELQRRTEGVTEYLFLWKDNLSNSLQIDPNNTKVNHSPELFMLHLLYHQVMILLHRPWTSRKNQPQKAQGRGLRHAQGVCISSARDIAQLLKLYERNHPLRHMHVHCVEIISAAALIMIALNGTSPESRKETVRQETASTLTIFFSALANLSRTYDKAKVARERLLETQRRWTKGKVSQNRLKRLSSPKRQHDADESKRSRDQIDYGPPGTSSSNVPPVPAQLYQNGYPVTWQLPQQYHPRM